MKCEEINFLEYLEGRAPTEIIAHIVGCSRCHSESDKLLRFSKVIKRHYAAGKKSERELENSLKSIDPAKIKKMPADKIKKMPAEIQKKIIKLKQKRLTSKIVDLFGGDAKTKKRLLKSVLTPEPFAIAASPKDITKSKKSTTRRKK